MIGKLVLSSIDHYGRGDFDMALRDAAIAIDSSAQNFYGKDQVGRKLYKDFLKEYLWIIDPMIGGGLQELGPKIAMIGITKKDPNGIEVPIKNPDITDFVYHVVRCNLAHGKDIPKNYGFTPSGDGMSNWYFDPQNGILRVPERLIWALIAVVVFCKANSHIQIDNDGYYLCWGSSTLGSVKFKINESWGKEDDLRNFFSTQDTSVKIVHTTRRH